MVDEDCGDFVDRQAEVASKQSLAVEDDQET